MNSEKLKMFLQLAENLNFNQASEARHVSPSTLSRAIQQLEHEVNAQLFYRDNRSVELTPAGRILQTQARDLLQLWDTTLDHLQLKQGELQGELSLYCSVTASYSFLYNILTTFRSKHSAIAITLHTGDSANAVERVAAGLDDIAIAVREDAERADMSFKLITQSPLILIAPKTLANFHLSSTELKSPEALAKVPLILSERGVGRRRLNNWLRHQKITPNIYAQVAGHEAIVSMVSLGFGVGLVPEIVAHNSPLADKVQKFAFQPKLDNYEIGVCVLNKRLKSPVVSAFWQNISVQTA